MIELTEREKDILAMWEGGLTGGQIGAKLGKTRGAILGVVCRMREKGYTVEHKVQPVLTPPPPRPKKERLRRARPSAAPPPPPDHELTIYELGPFTCRWPTSGNSKDGTMRYCGAKAVGHVYCEAHRRIAARVCVAVDV